MLDTVEQAAEVLVDTDPYTDRSGGLRDSTKAVLAADGDPLMIVLAMDRPYATYVERAGFSNFTDVAEDTVKALDVGMAAMRKRIRR